LASGTAATRRLNGTRPTEPTTVVELHGNAHFKEGVSTDVLIADAHRAFREGLRANLGTGFFVVGEAANVAELERLATTTIATLLLIGQDLPGGGLRAALEVAPATTRIVVFADEARDELVIEALQLGVSGYLLKNTPASSVGATLRAVMAGEPVIDRSLIRTLVGEITRQAPIRRLTVGGERVVLTPREQQVATLLVSGRSTREMAEALSVSTVTARRHISELMRKLRVASRAEAVELIVG
jgi:DNA-binding NarL/FixJ family response regulator